MVWAYPDDEVLFPAQECYNRSVRHLVGFYGKTPDKIDEKELEDYFLHRQQEDSWSAATLRIAYRGIKFFFANVLKQDLHLFKYLDAKRESRLPCILSRVVQRYLAHSNLETTQNIQGQVQGYYEKERAL